jgi:hypothetical protein
MRPVNQSKITDVAPCHTKRLEAPALKELVRPMQFSYLCTTVHTVHFTISLVRAVQRLMIKLSVNDNFERIGSGRSPVSGTIPTYAWRVPTQDSVTSDCYEGIHHLPDVVVQDQRPRTQTVPFTCVWINDVVISTSKYVANINTVTMDSVYRLILTMLIVYYG